MTKVNIILLAILILLLWSAVAFSRFLSHSFGFDPSIDDLGQWGDSFGAFNALFAALGFLGVIATLWLQQQQIRSAERDQHLQQFDNSFFTLLKLMREARDDTRFRYSDVYKLNNKMIINQTKSGVDAFRLAWTEAKYWIQHENAVSKSDVAKIYDRYVHNRYEGNFGPYFRLIYTILSDKERSCIR